jgi:hypothetical protein
VNHRALGNRPSLAASALRFVTKIVVGAMLVAAGAVISRADTVTVGELSFDELNPGATNAFTVYNFTGDDNLGFFPVLDNVDFNDITVTYTDLSGSTPLSLGDLTPDEVSTQAAVLASDTYLQVAFQATLSETLFNLGGGQFFQADSSTVTFTLLPSSPPDLQAGIDNGLINVSGTIVSAPAPEPPAGLMLLCGVCLLIYWKHARSGPVSKLPGLHS